MTPVEVIKGTSHIVLAMPHSGTYLPPKIADKLNDKGKELADTDWHLPQLYAGLLPEATIVKANFHRYVIDANRSPDDVSLYPNQNTTSLCPLIDFNSQPIWQEGYEPDTAEINQRKASFHTPYHTALQDALETAKNKHGFAILYDCHSIRSQIPFLFDGVLPTLNIGTNSGASCAPEIEYIANNICSNSNFSNVSNDRFKGGWTTRHYGQPENNIHAIQMEITQSAYMSEQSPWQYLTENANILRKTLKDLLESLERFTNA